jgi:F0F1-type ATP synthase delta subunit
MALTRTYAAAVDKLAASGTSDVVADLVAHLKRRGRLKLLPGILAELKKMAAKRSVSAAHLEAASEAELKEAKELIAKEGIVAAEAVINPDLLRGWRVRAGGMLVDRSGKRGLIDLYQRITR